MKKILKYSPRYYEPFDECIIYINLNTSNKCNFRCMKCMQSEAINANHSKKAINFLDLIERARRELGVRSLYLSGEGETFLFGSGNQQTMLENYKTFIKHTNELGMDIIQFTNGYFLTKDMTDFLTEYRVSLVISLDTLDEKKHGILTGTGSGVFKRVMGNIKYARTKFPVTLSGRTRLYRLGINMAISHICLEDIESLISYCSDNIIFFSNYPLIKGRFKENLEQMCLTEDEYEKFIHLCSETSAYKGLAGVTMKGICDFLRHGLSIDFDGHVLICPYDSDSCRLFGHINKFPLLRDAYDLVQNRLLKFAQSRQNAMYCPLRHKDYEMF